MRIGELAARSGVSVRALRYYEEQDLLAPQRTAAGHRIYSDEDRERVLWIQEFFKAGFCSAVIRDLLLAVTTVEQDGPLLESAFDAAQDRLESEMESVAAEMVMLKHLRRRLGLAPDAHVRVHHEVHDSISPASTTSFDHRDRRLR